MALRRRRGGVRLEEDSHDEADNLSLPSESDDEEVENPSVSAHVTNSDVAADVKIFDSASAPIFVLSKVSQPKRAERPPRTKKSTTRSATSLSAAQKPTAPRSPQHLFQTDSSRNPPNDPTTAAASDMSAHELNRGDDSRRADVQGESQTNRDDNDQHSHHDSDRDSVSDGQHDDDDDETDHLPVRGRASALARAPAPPLDPWDVPKVGRFFLHDDRRRGGGGGARGRGARGGARDDRVSREDGSADQRDVPERARGRQQLWQSPEEAAADALVWTHDKFDELMQLEEEHPLKPYRGRGRGRGSRGSARGSSRDVRHGRSSGPVATERGDAADERVVADFTAVKVGSMSPLNPRAAKFRPPVGSSASSLAVSFPSSFSASTAALMANRTESTREFVDEPSLSALPQITWLEESVFSPQPASMNDAHRRTFDQLVAALHSPTATAATAQPPHTSQLHDSDSALAQLPEEQVQHPMQQAAPLQEPPSHEPPREQTPHFWQQQQPQQQEPVWQQQQQQPQQAWQQQPKQYQPFRPQSKPFQPQQSQLQQARSFQHTVHTTARFPSSPPAAAAAAPTPTYGSAFVAPDAYPNANAAYPDAAYTNATYPIAGYPDAGGYADASYATAGYVGGNPVPPLSVYAPSYLSPSPVPMGGNVTKARAPPGFSPPGFSPPGFVAAAPTWNAVAAPMADSPAFYNNYYYPQQQQYQPPNSVPVGYGSFPAFDPAFQQFGGFSSPTQPEYGYEQQQQPQYQQQYQEQQQHFVSDNSGAQTQTQSHKPKKFSET